MKTALRYHRDALTQIVNLIEMREKLQIERAANLENLRNERAIRELQISEAEKMGLREYDADTFLRSKT